MLRTLASLGRNCLSPKELTDRQHLTAAAVTVCVCGLGHLATSGTISSCPVLLLQTPCTQNCERTTLRGPRGHAAVAVCLARAPLLFSKSYLHQSYYQATHKNCERTTPRGPRGHAAVAVCLARAPLLFSKSYTLTLFTALPELLPCTHHRRTVKDTKGLSRARCLRCYYSSKNPTVV